MKLKFTISFLIFSISTFSQNSTALTFQDNLIKTEISTLERSGRIGDYKIVRFIEANRVEAHLNDLLIQGPEQIYISRNRKDSLQLTEDEFQAIIEFFKSKNNLTYSPDSTERLIAGDDYFGYLNRNPDNIVISVSKPLFLRNNKFGVCVFSSFYDGGIYGPSSLSIYIHENGNWIRWFDMSSGMF